MKYFPIHVLIGCISIFTSISVIAQESDAMKPNNQKIQLSVFAIPGIAFPSGNNDSFFKDLSSKTGFSMSGGLSGAYMFNNFFGIVTGIAYSSNSFTQSLDSIKYTFEDIDSEGESYTMLVSASFISQSQLIQNIEIPINLLFDFRFSKHFGIFISPGLNMWLPLSADFESSGLYTYKGYYPAYNVTLENLPKYGFTNNTYSEVNGQANTESIVFGFALDAGFDIRFSEKTGMKVSFNMKKSLTGFSKDVPEDENFVPSNGMNQANSFLRDYTSIGCQIGFLYFLSPR